MKKLVFSYLLFTGLYSFNQTQDWVQIGDDLNVTNPGYERIKFDRDGNAFYAYSNQSSGNSLNVHRFNGSTWSVVGSADITSTAVYVKDIAIDTLGMPYVAIVNASNQITVIKFNGTVWDTLGSANFAQTNALSYRPALAVDPVTNHPVVAYRDLVSNRLSVMKWDGTTWDYFNNGQDLSAGNVSLIEIAIAENQATYVGYADGANGDSLTVIWTYNFSSNWIMGAPMDMVVSNGPISSLSIDLDAAYPVVGYTNSTDNKVYIHRLSGAPIWHPCPENAGTADFYKDIAIKRHLYKTYVAFVDSDLLYKPNVKYTDDADFFTGLSQSGTPGFYNDTPYNIIFGSDQDDNLYLAFDLLTVKVYKLTTISQASIDETKTDENDWKIFPNPTSSGLINIEKFTDREHIFELIGTDGKVIYQQTIVSENTTVNLNGIDPGTYFIRISSETSSTIKKLIII